ncbi:MAG: hypothetical protein ACREMU_13240, partial [Gemmatimonadaceae bacterium]
MSHYPLIVAVVYFVMLGFRPSDQIPMHSRMVGLRAWLVAGAFALMLAPSAGAQAKGYTLDDILGLLKRHVSSARVLSLAKTSCVTFEMTDDVGTRLKRAGGTV